MTKRAPEPSDAPYGPIVRYFRRWSIGDGVTKGGAFGCDAPSPRLKGWLEIAGFDLTGLSRTIDASTSWAIATPDALRNEAKIRVVAAKLATLQPLAVRLWEDHGPKHGKDWLSKRIAAAFADPHAFPEEVQNMVRSIIALGVLETAKPRAGAVADWMDGKTLDEILGDRRSAFADQVATLKPLIQWVTGNVEFNDETRPHHITKAFLTDMVMDWLRHPDYDLSNDAAQLADDILASGFFVGDPYVSSVREKWRADILRWIDPLSIEELTSGE